MDRERLRKIAEDYKEEIMYPYDSIYEIIGFDALEKISEIFSGSQIYIPKKKYIFAGCIEKQILSEYNGKNLKALAKKYSYCENTIRKIVTADFTAQRLAVKDRVNQMK